MYIQSAFRCLQCLELLMVMSPNCRTIVHYCDVVRILMWRHLRAVLIYSSCEHAPSLPLPPNYSQSVSQSVRPSSGAPLLPVCHHCCRGLRSRCARTLPSFLPSSLSFDRYLSSINLIRGEGSSSANALPQCRLPTYTWSMVFPSFRSWEKKNLPFPY